MGEILVGLVLVGRAVANGTVQVMPVKLLFFIVSVTAGAIIYPSVKSILAFIAFWLKDSSAIMTTAYEVADFAKYPTEIYAKPIRVILMTILPFAFVAYISSAFFLIDDNLWKTIGAECVVAAVIWMIAYKIFQKGTSVYESAGN